jgi:hypothetical protein
MPTAKAQYDCFGEKKSQKYNFSQQEWDDLRQRVRRELRSLYPHNNDVDDDPTFGHPADAWASRLLEVAHTEVSTWWWLEERLTNEELRAEQADILRALEKAKVSLSEMSYDLHNLLDSEVDVLECRDLIAVIIPHIKELPGKISALDRAKKYLEVQHKAALRMTVEVVRFLENDGTPVIATANKYHDRFSDAVKILKVLGDALKLRLDETTWRDRISEARPMIAVHQSLDAPVPKGA